MSLRLRAEWICDKCGCTSYDRVTVDTLVLPDGWSGTDDNTKCDECTENEVVLNDR